MQDVSSLVARQGRQAAGRGPARPPGGGGVPQLREVMAALAPLTGNAYVVGLTGSPGVGKSTSTSALVTAYRRQGKRVGVLAVDPSSAVLPEAPCSATVCACPSTPPTPALTSC